MPVDPASPPAAPASPPDRWGREDPYRYRRHHHHHHHRGHGILPGLVLISWGGLLLLREQGIIDPSLRVGDFWPLVVIGLGLGIAVGGRHLFSWLVGAVVALLGAGLLAQKLGYPVALARPAHLWPILFIVAGVGVIWKGLTRRSRPRQLADEQVSADELQRQVTMGGLALVVDSQQFRGGSLGVTMGEIRADLRRATMAGEEATLDLSVTMGGIELYLPSSWQVVSDVSPFMGVVEDKTEPRPDAAGVQRRLVLRGKITMGAVNIRN
jgi:hypothetical protein